MKDGYSRLAVSALRASFAPRSSVLLYILRSPVLIRPEEQKDWAERLQRTGNECHDIGIPEVGTLLWGRITAIYTLRGYCAPTLLFLMTRTTPALQPRPAWRAAL